MNRWTPALFILCLLGSGCNFTGVSAMSEDDDSTIQIKENPNPQKAYRLTMVIEDAPGPFAMVEGSAQYDVTNHETCGRVMPVSKTVSRINTHSPLKWEKISENTYTTVIHTDLMVDEDYYGHGVCKWAFTTVSASLKATGAKEETAFLPELIAEDVVRESSAKWYFWKAGYPKERMDDYADFGEKDARKYRPEIQSQLFSISLKSEGI